MAAIGERVTALERDAVHVVARLDQSIQTLSALDERHRRLGDRVLAVETQSAAMAIVPKLVARVEAVESQISGLRNRAKAAAFVLMTVLALAGAVPLESLKFIAKLFGVG